MFCTSFFLFSLTISFYYVHYGQCLKPEIVWAAVLLLFLLFFYRESVVSWPSYTISRWRYCYHTIICVWLSAFFVFAWAVLCFYFSRQYLGCLVYRVLKRPRKGFPCSIGKKVGREFDLIFSFFAHRSVGGGQGRDEF